MNVTRGNTFIVLTRAVGSGDVGHQEGKRVSE
jgi:hypothetical protein